MEKRGCEDRRVNDLESQGWPAAGRQCIVMAANACLRRAEVYRGVLTQAAEQVVRSLRVIDGAGMF